MRPVSHAPSAAVSKPTPWPPLGASPLAAVDALREAGAEVVGVAVLVNRGARERVTEHGLTFRAAYDLSDLGI